MIRVETRSKGQEFGWITQPPPEEVFLVEYNGTSWMAKSISTSAFYMSDTYEGVMQMLAVHVPNAVAT